MNVARRFRRGVGLAWGCFLVAGPVSAQWMTQTVSLRPGWNAVYVEVQPEPAAFDAVFGGSPVESVWVWNKRFSPVEFELDPETPLAPSPHWLAWLPSADPASFLSQAHRLQACQAYLIRVRTNAAPFSVALKGKAVLPHLEWFPHSLNLVGFPVNPAAPPTFAEFFAPAPQVDTTKGSANQLFALDEAGRGRTIVQPFRERLAPGAAYWVKCQGSLDYEGPLRVTAGSGSGLDFGVAAQKLGMSVDNLSSDRSYTVTVAPVASEPPPAGQAELAGPVPLYYLVGSVGTSNDLAWTNLSAQGTTKTLAPGETWSLQLGLRRSALADYAPTGTNGAAYQGILRVTDSAQSLRIHVPVVAEKDGVRRLSSAKADYDLGDHHSDEGLWVGQAVVGEVTCPSYSATNLLPTASACGFRLLLHVDAYGQVKLLQRVYLAWTGAETNGQYRLFLDEASIPADAAEVKRISSAAFPFMGAVAATNRDGSAANGLTNRLGAAVTVSCNDPTNPYRHPYHPLLDNQDWNFAPYTNAVESRTVERDLTLDFGANAFTNGAPDPFYGVHEIGGAYEEVLGGLRQQPIRVRGTFHLKRVSLVNELR